MSPVAVLRLPIQTDLSGFIVLLRRLQVPHRVSEEAGEQVLWVPNELAEQVHDLYVRYPQGDAALQAPASPPAAAGFVQQLRDSPLTAGMLGLTLVFVLLQGMWILKMRRPAVSSASMKVVF